MHSKTQIYILQSLSMLQYKTSTINTGRKNVNKQTPLNSSVHSSVCAARSVMDFMSIAKSSAFTFSIERQTEGHCRTLCPAAV